MFLHFVASCHEVGEDGELCRIRREALRHHTLCNATRNTQGRNTVTPSPQEKSAGRQNDDQRQRTHTTSKGLTVESPRRPRRVVPSDPQDDPALPENPHPIFCQHPIQLNNTRLPAARQRSSGFALETWRSERSCECGALLHLLIAFRPRAVMDGDKRTRGLRIAGLDSVVVAGVAFDQASQPRSQSA